MTAILVDGRQIAAQLLESIGDRTQILKKRGIVPQLAFVMLGESKPATLYANRLEKLAKPVGMQVARRHLPGDTSLLALAGEVGALNADSTVDGILIQMPLPAHLLGADLSTVLDRRKDVDGVTVQNAGRLYFGLPGHHPSTAAAMMYILETCGIELSGRHAVVVGRSKIVGHPMVELLLHRDATVTVTHSRTRDLATFTRRADILVTAVGKPGMISSEMISPGVVILDAGITVTESGVAGDVLPECEASASLMTPVPGGVGPVTNAVLLRGVVASAEHRGA